MSEFQLAYMDSWWTGGWFDDPGAAARKCPSIRVRVSARAPDRVLFTLHYNGVIMSAIASQITSLTIVYPTVYSRRRSKKTSKLRINHDHWPLWGEFIGDRWIPRIKPSNAENVSIWWRHHGIRSSDPRLSEAMAILVACSSDHVHRRLWACALHNLGRTRTSAPEEIATCNDELGHGRPRQTSRTRTRISVNTKHQFTWFDCFRARTRMLRPRSRM